jgi:hypothetical protein
LYPELVHPDKRAAMKGKSMLNSAGIAAALAVVATGAAISVIRIARGYFTVRSLEISDEVQLKSLAFCARQEISNPVFRRTNWQPEQRRR